MARCSRATPGQTGRSRSILGRVRGIRAALLLGVGAACSERERPPSPSQEVEARPGVGRDAGMVAGGDGATAAAPRDGGAPDTARPIVRDGAGASPSGDAGDDVARADTGPSPRFDAGPSAPPDADATVQPDARPDAAVAGPVFADMTSEAGLLYLQGPQLQPDDCGLSVFSGCGPQLTGGAAAGDYDGDGWVDLYVTRIDGPDILFRNRGDGTFEDMTLSAGLALDAPTNGAGWADIDNDGDLDLYVTTLGGSRSYLYVNDGAGSFTEEAVERGVSMEGPGIRHGFSVSFGDYDRDGFVDLFVSEWRPASIPGGDGPHSRLFRNLGATSPGYFEDVTVAAGVSLEGLRDDGEWAFTASFTDLDDDGWPDLVVVADLQASRLFWNNGDGTFTDGTVAAGVGTDESGMGSALGDYDGDGRIDWFVTAIACDDPECDLGATGNRLYRNDGDRRFSDHTDRAGVRNGRWGWAAAFLDYDNDGDLDLVMTNGMDIPEDEDGIFRYDPMRFWRNDGSGRMTEIAGRIGLTDTGNGRGLLVFDYDNDGDLDIFITRNGQTPILYRNDGGNTNGWLRLRLVGTHSARDAWGARVTVRPGAGRPPMVRELVGGNHYLAQSEAVLDFGLGPEPGPVEEVRIRWPRSGSEQVLTAVAPNQTLVVTEPAPP